MNILASTGCLQDLNFAVGFCNDIDPPYRRRRPQVTGVMPDPRLPAGVDIGGFGTRIGSWRGLRVAACRENCAKRQEENETTRGAKWHSVTTSKKVLNQWSTVRKSCGGHDNRVLQIAGCELMIGSSFPANPRSNKNAAA